MPNDTEGHPYPRERTWPDCEKEVERLRKHHKIAVDNWTLEAQTVKQQEDEIHGLKAEIERLRHEMAEMAVANVAATKAAVGSYQAEIERLRSELDACGACMKRADAEIERLRAYIAEVGRPIGAHSYE